MENTLPVTSYDALGAVNGLMSHQLHRVTSAQITHIELLFKTLIQFEIMATPHWPEDKTLASLCLRVRPHPTGLKTRLGLILFENKAIRRQDFGLIPFEIKAI